MAEFKVRADGTEFFVGCYFGCIVDKYIFRGYLRYLYKHIYPFPLLHLVRLLYLVRPFFLHQPRKEHIYLHSWL